MVSGSCLRLERLLSEISFLVIEPLPEVVDDGSFRYAFASSLDVAQFTRILLFECANVT